MDNSQSDIELDIIIAASAVVCLKNIKKQPRKRRFYVNEYLQERNKKGRYARDFQDLIRNPSQFKQNFRVSPDAFEELRVLLASKLNPKARSRPDSLSADHKLALTLEFLASGDLFRHLASVYRISSQQVGVVVEETCDAILSTLKEKVFKGYTEASWIEAANDFNSIWNFPNCLGAVDGKHVAIKCPNNAGSLFFNYKGYHSIVLMAVADAQYRFLYYDIGAHGSEGDGAVFRDCDFGKKLMNESLCFPPDGTIIGTPVPFFFLGDDAFPLHKRIMKPYAPRDRNSLTVDQRIFNYRLSRARRCVENAFGILSSRWMCLARTLFMTTTRAQKIVTACCILHNYLLDSDKIAYCPVGFSDTLADNGDLVEGAWRANVHANSLYNRSFNGMNNGRPTLSSKQTRDLLCKYVNSTIGAVSWQNDKI